jgi:hypothetical protein
MNMKAAFANSCGSQTIGMTATTAGSGYMSGVRPSRTRDLDQSQDTVFCRPRAPARQTKLRKIALRISDPRVVECDLRRDKA